MIKSKIVFSFLCVFLCAPIFAEKVTPIGVGCDTVSGDCFIRLKTQFINTTCDNKWQLRLSPDERGTKGQYSAALAAFMAGKKLEAGSTSCYGNFPTPSYLYVIE